MHGHMASYPNFLSLPNASRPVSSSSSSSAVVASVTSAAASSSTFHPPSPSPSPTSTLPFPSPVGADNRDWQCFKDHLKKIGLPEDFLQAMDNDCPSWDILNRMVYIFETQKRQDVSQNLEIMSLRKQLEKRYAEVAELKDFANVRDAEYNATVKRFKQASADCEAQKMRADRAEAALKHEHDDRVRVAAELGSRDLDIMELKAKVQHLEATYASTAVDADKMASLMAANKTLTANQVTLKNQLLLKDIEVKKLQEKVNELTKELDNSSAERDKIAEAELQVAKTKIDELQQQAQQWKANLVEFRESARIQMEIVKRENAKEMLELKRKLIQDNSTTEKASSSSPSPKVGSTSPPSSSCGEVGDSSTPDNMRKLQELLRLQTQVATKVQEQNRTLRAELDKAKDLVVALREEKGHLEKQLAEALMACHEKLAGIKTEPDDVRKSIADPALMNGGANLSLHYLPPPAMKYENHQSFMKTGDMDCNFVKQDDHVISCSINDDDLLSGLEEIEPRVAIDRLRSRLFVRSARVFSLEKELSECRGVCDSLVKQIQDAEKELENKDEYIITLRRRLRWSQAENQRLAGNNDSTSEGGSLEAVEQPPPAKVPRRNFRNNNTNTYQPPVLPSSPTPKFHQQTFSKPSFLNINKRRDQ